MVMADNITQLVGNTPLVRLHEDLAARPLTSAGPQHRLFFCTCSPKSHGRPCQLTQSRA